MEHQCSENTPRRCRTASWCTHESKPSACSRPNFVHDTQNASHIDIADTIWARSSHHGYFPFDIVALHLSAQWHFPARRWGGGSFTRAASTQDALNPYILDFIAMTICSHYTLMLYWFMWHYVTLCFIMLKQFYIPLGSKCAMYIILDSCIVQCIMLHYVIEHYIPLHYTILDYVCDYYTLLDYSIV